MNKINHEPTQTNTNKKEEFGAKVRVRTVGTVCVVRGKFLFLILFFLSLSVSSQDAAQNSPVDFFLVSVIETAFSGDLRWRPDWPDYFPSDGFLLSKEDRLPEIIELGDGTQNFVVRRDGKGRLIEFPLLNENGYLKVEAAYAETGALTKMSISMKNYTSQDASSEEKNWNVTFPDNFLPYSDLSLGGSFPPVTASCGDSDFYVFIFESPQFLTETWYDGNSNMIAFCKAQVNRDKNWRVRSLQVHDEAGFYFEDYFFDSFGNISEVRFSDRVFSALYRYSFPIYWQCPDFRYELQWDAQGLLRVIKASGISDEEIEYRYEYEVNGGDWVKRQETAVITRLGLLAPQPSSSRGVWDRRITFSEANGD